MARGWESKAIEDQLEEAVRRKQEAGRPVLPTELIALRERRESLQLSQSLLRAQLTSAKTEAQRQWLTDALQQLALELAQVDVTPVVVE